MTAPASDGQDGGVGMGGPVAVIDTAGRHALVALGGADGSLLAEARWEAGFRHGEELLVRLDALLESAGVPLGVVRGIVVGTGPGAFTGLRVGLATAKALASGLRVPIAGVATSAALLDAVRANAAGPLALLLPAGPSDRVMVEDRPGFVAQLVRAGDDIPLGPEVTIVAVDLEGRAPEAALELGRRAESGLGRSMLRLGVEALRSGGADLATLVPEYVSLPRGVAAVGGEVRWSRDRG